MSRRRSDCSFRRIPLTASMTSLSRRSFSSRVAGADGIATRFSVMFGTDESATCDRTVQRGFRLGLFVAIFFLGSGKQLEEGIEAAVECPPQLWNRSVDRVKR